MGSLKTVLLVCALALPACADIWTLNPDNVLEYTFQTNPSAWDGTAPDFLELNLITNGSFSPAEPLSDLTVKLYDGNTLLGTYVSPFTGPISNFMGLTVGEWVSATSPNSNFPFGQPTKVDFTSILDGTIQGRIDITISSGAMNFDFPFDGGTSENYPRLGYISAPNVVTSRPGIVDTSVQITPEPGSIALLGSVVLLALGLRSRSKK